MRVRGHHEKGNDEHRDRTNLPVHGEDGDANHRGQHSPHGPQRRTQETVGANAADSGERRQRDEHDTSGKGQLHPPCRPHTGEQRRRKDNDRNDEGRLLHAHKGKGRQQRGTHLGDRDVTQAQGVLFARHLRVEAYVIDLDRGLERTVEGLEREKGVDLAPLRRVPGRRFRSGARQR